MLMGRQNNFKKKSQDYNSKSEVSKRNPNEMKKLYNMINSNTKYLNVPHGLPEHMKRATSSQMNEFMDRNKIYAKRSENPMVIPTKIIEIP